MHTTRSSRPSASAPADCCHAEGVMSLRAILATAMLVIGLSAVGAALSLVVMAAYMHQAITETTAATESVHTAEEMEVDLLVHDRVTEPLARAQLEGQLRGWLLEIRKYV